MGIYGPLMDNQREHENDIWILKEFMRIKVSKVKGTLESALVSTHLWKSTTIFQIMLNQAFL